MARRSIGPVNPVCDERVEIVNKHVLQMSASDINAVFLINLIQSEHVNFSLARNQTQKTTTTKDV